MSFVGTHSALVWLTVYLGLGGFYLLASRRFPDQGYRKFAAVMVCLALSAFSGWYRTSAPGAEEGGWVAGRLTVFAAAFAPALNTHFLVQFTRYPVQRRWLWFGYVLALLIVVVDASQALRNLVEFERTGVSSTVPVVRGWLFNEAKVNLPFAPSARLGVLMGALLLIHFIADFWLLYLAYRGGRKAVFGPLLLFALIGPLVVVDYSLTFISRISNDITEFAVWIYGLSIALALLSDLRGAEGLLARTTSSLAERTAELEISYAELELMHSELTQKEQLAAVGELAAAIAHEVRNPLAVIVNAVSGLRRETILPKDRETLLSIVEEEAGRLNHLVSELLRFARPVSAARAPVSLEDILGQVMRDGREGYEIRVRRPKDDDLGTLWIDAGLFRLALDNLIENAAQAMPEGGVIDVVLRRGHLSDGEQAAVIEVRDQGVGMSVETMERAKKPFFTTRPRGTGLGLPIVQRILDAHGGELEIASVEKKGTVVAMRLPLERISLLPAQTRSPSSSASVPRRRLRSRPITGGFGEGASSSRNSDAPIPPEVDG